MLRPKLYRPYAYSFDTALTKIPSAFQMNRVVIVGHSLSDQNFRHVLEAAKRGTSVQQPVYWIAPDVTVDQARKWGCAQSSLNLLDERTITHVMGGLIDETRISIQEEREAYEENLGSKYGEPMEAVLSSIKPMNRPLAAIQLAHEITQKQEHRRQQAEQLTAAATKRAIAAERKLAEVEKFRAQMDARKAKSKRNVRNQRSEKSSKKGK